MFNLAQFSLQIAPINLSIIMNATKITPNSSLICTYVLTIYKYIICILPIQVSNYSQQKRSKYKDSNEYECSKIKPGKLTHLVTWKNDILRKEGRKEGRMEGTCTYVPPLYSLMINLHE